MTIADWLSETQNTLLSDAVEAIRRGVGENLFGVALVGAGVKPLRHDGPVKLKVVVFVAELPVATLTNLAHQCRDVVRRGLQLEVLTKRELLRSGDVFALRFVDYRARHHVLYGKDPFQSLHVTEADLRLAIERQLRLSAHGVRGAIVSGMDRDGEVSMMRMRLQLIIEDVVTIAVHLLHMFGTQPPDSERDLLQALAKHTGTDVRLLMEAIESLRTSDKVSQYATLRSSHTMAHPVAALAELATLIEDATNAIDRYGAAAS